MPKQFHMMSGRTILETTVSKFESCAFVDEIIIVSHGDYMDYCSELFAKQVEQGLITVIPGGNERQDSIYCAIKQISRQKPQPTSLVLIHDGVRPFVSRELIERVAKETIRTGAVIPAVPPKDTIRHVEEGTLDRSRLCCVQTPQGFELGLIERAFQEAERDGFYGTDDAGLVERIGHKVSIVDGDHANYKITTPEDLAMESRIGTGFDVHQLTENRKLILGGVDIPYEKGLLGHSDADVLVHALMDAMLGAAACGDIGKLFPDSDDTFKGISSLKLLEKVGQVLAEKGYSLGNADMTIICQKPKLAGYIDEMRSNIASVLDTEPDRISIKATTTEKLGFTGRGEGIAAEAVCILNR